jgi:N-acetyl-anhydromuramyl-L-alanine amidase AmpD
MITTLKTWLAHRSRTAKMPASTIVLHSTDGASASSSISWLRQIGYSYHYVIERSGEVTKCVPTSKVAFHAGKSVGPSARSGAGAAIINPNVNEFSIGISFANRESKSEPITDKQVEAAIELIDELCKADERLVFLTTHYAISPGRKTDPAMLRRADIDRIAESGGLEVWGVRK